MRAVCFIGEFTNYLPQTPQQRQNRRARATNASLRRRVYVYCGNYVIPGAYMTILVIDDDFELFALLEEFLSGEGFVCRHAADPENGLRAARAKDVDVVILDVMLPGMNGFEVLRHIRTAEETRNLPVVMLTAKGDEVDRVVGLEMGADDYVAKPFSPRELVARLRAVLRRSGTVKTESAAPVQVVGDLSINPSALCATVGAAHHNVTVAEMRLLVLLCRDAGTVVGRDLLYAEIFGHPAYPGDRSLDMLVSRLRKKLGPRADGGERLKAVRGEGYMYLIGEDVA